MTTPVAPPPDYLERIYAGVLGKIIGVYLGRPFEQWSHERIEKELGEIWYYVHERLKMELIVTDDDITGTFTFIRALEDHGNTADLTAEQIGNSWLNYIIEKKTILWWGGVGMSTEHTAFRRLQDGIPAPRSGSIELNSPVVAEQIGAQIFIDGWAMVAPNNPKLAAEFARKAGSVSHDGEAIYGAQVIAAMESAAFGERDLQKLIDIGLAQIPADCTIATLIRDLRDCRRKTDNWRDGLKLIHEKYSYEKFGGGCHMVPNHAVIMLGLLWGDDDFQKSQMITNTAGYDTDCNAANVGCLMSIKNGLASINAGADFRGPVADRLLVPTADAGSAISDAATVALRIANMGYRLAGLPPIAPKNGAKFHFSLPGSVQGFLPADTIESAGMASVSNANGRLRIDYRGLAPGRVARAATATFIQPTSGKHNGYSLVLAPTLYAGQTVTADLIASPGNKGPVDVAIFIGHFGDKDVPVLLSGPAKKLAAGESATLTWTLPDIAGQPIYQVGLQISGTGGASGQIDLDRLTWTGEPSTALPIYNHRPLSREAWAAGVDHQHGWGEHVNAVQDRGEGLLITGTRDWCDITFTSTLQWNLAKRCGVAIRVQGMKRYYAAVVDRAGNFSLIKMLDRPTVLASAPLATKTDGQRVAFSISAKGNRITARVGDQMLSAEDNALDCGGVALLIEEGRIQAYDMAVRPAE